MKRWSTLCRAAMFAAAAFSVGLLRGEEPRFDAARAAELVSKWGRHLVPVEFWLQKSEGEAPQGGSLSRELEEKRPHVASGLAVDGETVWMPDPSIEQRFIVRVAAGHEKVEASMLGRILGAPGLVLKTARPMAGIGRLSFAAAESVGDPSSLIALYGSIEDAEWTVTASSTWGQFQFQDDGAWVRSSPGLMLLTRSGEPAGYTFSNRLPLKKLPCLWRGGEIAAAPLLTHLAFTKLKMELEARSRELLATVRVSFRREEEEEDSSGLRRRMFSDDEGGELDDLLASGFAIDSRSILVHHSLTRAQAQRLDRIEIELGDSKRPATFIGAFRDYGVFAAQIADGDALPAHVELPPEPGAGFAYHQPLLCVSADHSTGKRRERVDFERVTDWLIGYANVKETVVSPFPRQGALIYSADGSVLLGAVIEVRREPDAHDADSQYAYAARRYRSSYYPQNYGIDLRVLTLAELRGIVESAPASFDPRLKPLSKDREKDMVWYGVEFQPLNRELARNFGVEIASRGGEIGLMTLFVYPDSPAARGGIEPRDILLSVRDLSKDQPVELRAGDGNFESSEFLELPEEIPEELREEFLSQMPPPWRSPRNALNGLLHSFGAGADIELKYLRGGEEKTHRFKLELGPPDFESAAKEKIEAIGITVKDLTYEVRTHFRFADESPGVVVAKIESGSPVAVSKILPYEIITSVNGEPVRSAKEFRGVVEKSLETESGKTLEFRVERLGKSRLVKIRA